MAEDDSQSSTRQKTGTFRPNLNMRREDSETQRQVECDLGGSWTPSSARKMTEKIKKMP